MKKMTYNITLEAPIGEKTGTMTAEISDDKIAGTIFVMNAENSFSGAIDDTGRCTVSGSLKTLLYQLSYVGSGMLTDDSVLLELKTEKYSLLLKGEKCDE